MRNVAREGLMNLLDLTEKQAQAILDLRLQRLTQLEISKLVEEQHQLLEKIAYLKSVLADENLVLGIIRDELALDWGQAWRRSAHPDCGR
jgi:DNA gyrase subunit A